MGIGRLAKKIRDRESELMPDQVTYGGGDMVPLLHYTLK